MTSMRNAAGPALLAVCASLSAPATADDAELEELRQQNAEMREMMMQMQQQLQELAIKAEAAEKAARKTRSGDGKKGRVGSEKENLTITTTGGGIKVKSDKGASMAIGGFLQMDHEDLDDLWGAGGEENRFRRTRFTFKGDASRAWSYRNSATAS